MKKLLPKIVTCIFLLVALINVLFPIIKNLDKFTERFDPKLYEKKYNNSQYVIPNSKNPISDEVLLSYAGYKYATGLNPVLINSDHPPLGKYVIGWITLLTGNNRIVSILFALGNIALVGSIILLITSSPLLVSVGILFITFDTMLIDQIIYSPILDIIQVFFLLAYFLFLIMWLKKTSFWKLLSMGIMLGCMGSVKLYFPIFVVLFSTIVSLILLKKSFKDVLKIIFILLFCFGIVYTLSYFIYFLSGNSFKTFLGTQKWIFLFWKNNSVQNTGFIGDALTLILFNQWKVWWGNIPYIHYERWSILWPLFFNLGLFSSILILSNVLKSFFIKTKKILFNNLLVQSSVVFSIWIITSTCYLSLLPISPRYIMILFFPIYILLPLMVKLIITYR